ncbi:FAD:protein FMN transferase [soil metagenome]
MSVATPAAPAEPLVRRVEHVMGMPISLAVRGAHADTQRGLAAWADVLRSLRWADDVFSTWRDDTVIARLGRGEITEAECPPEVAKVLWIGEAARLASYGAFAVRREVDGREVLDPSGVVKGWAVERASAALTDLPDTDWCLSAGGDLLCHTRPGHEPWRIVIEDPADPRRTVAVIPVHRGAVATSGTAHRGEHLRHATTGLAPSGIASVTVVHDSLTIADVDATSAYLQGLEASAWLRHRGRTGVVVRPWGEVEILGR